MVDSLRLTDPVFVDRDMWEKIVLDLLSNAFKFTFEGEIAVTLRQVTQTRSVGEGSMPAALAHASGLCELSVRDTGKGIPVAEMPRLFQRFHRVENARGTSEGSGIGLALVQELVKLHGGSISAESVVGRGTTFTVTVPLGSAHLPPEQIGQARSPASTGTGASPYVEEALRWLPDDLEHESESRSELPTYHEPLPTPYLRPEPDESDDRPRVLVADDNADMRQYVVRLLAEHHRIVAVPDGEAALAAAREQPPDLILTDVMMPRLDGFGLLRELRADPRTSGSPVIMLSARAGEESRVEGMEAGADDYLVKPFGARELQARVSAHLQMARLRREAGEGLRVSEQRFRHMADAAPVLIWMSGTDTLCTWFNKSWLEFVGRSIEQEIGNGWAENVHPDDFDRCLKTYVTAFDTRQAYSMEYRLRRHDGEYRWVLNNGIPQYESEGKFAGYIGSGVDITARVQAEEALKEADRRKNEFLATLAHELRNPLAPLRNGLQIMRLKQRDEGREARGEKDTFVGDLRAPHPSPLTTTFEMMERQLGQMVRLIDDLLDVSRISRGKIELRKGRVELASIVNQAVEAARPRCESKGLELTVTLSPQPVYLHADPIRLAQAFANLLNNAAKFTAKRGRIWLTVERAGRQAVIRVRDTGIGIVADQFPRIFDMFVQVDTSLERTQSGLGIGLTGEELGGAARRHGRSAQCRSRSRE